MARLDIACPACGASHFVDSKIPFRAECDCGQDLHVCLTCRFYDPYVENECREVSADPVANKDRRNLCEYHQAVTTDDDDGQSEADAAKQKLAALFGGAAAPSSPQTADDAKKKLEALFKKKD